MQRLNVLFSCLGPHIPFFFSVDYSRSRAKSVSSCLDKKINLNAKDLFCLEFHPSPVCLCSICSMPFGCTHSSWLVVWIGYPSTDRLKYSRRACRFSLSGEFSMLICHVSSTLSMERKPKWHTTYTNIPDFIVVFVVCWYSQGFKQPPTNTDCNDMHIPTRLFMETLLLMLHLQSCFKVFFLFSLETNPTISELNHFYVCWFCFIL